MTAPYYADASVTLHNGDCLDVMRDLPDSSVDAVCTDPPYGLKFMGREWDAPWRVSDVNADAGFHGGGIDATRKLPSFTGSTNPKCVACKGTRRGRRDGTAVVPFCLCPDGGRFPNVRAVEMQAFGAWCEQWAAECLRVLKPGGHLLAFGGTRTWHRLACAVEDAGFEVRDSIAWMYGSGFPKSLDVSKAIDKAAGAERAVVAPSRFAARKPNGSAGVDSVGLSSTPGLDITAPATDDARRWQGWGTALKPAFEPIVVARKPLAGTVAVNVLAHGTGALNIDRCRVASSEDTARTPAVVGDTAAPFGRGEAMGGNGSPLGRWPANVVLDDTQAAEVDRQSGMLSSGLYLPEHADNGKAAGTLGAMAGRQRTAPTYGDSGGASRFFPTFRYEPKAPSVERPRDGETAHCTVKPLGLMRWLVRLVTPPGGTVLDPFSGSGTTAEACVIEGFRCIAIEREATYLPLIVARLTKPIQPDLFGGVA